MRDRLIDEVVREVLDKSLLEEITHMCITPNSYEELMADYADEFEIELLEVGRESSKEDLEEYLNIKIVIGYINDKRYELLKKG